jgi:flagellar hook-associated protein 1
MGLFDALNISTLGMAAQQTGLQVTGNNIANVSTPGYHRQEVVLEALALPGGVDVAEVRSVYNSLLERRLDTAAARNGAAEATVNGAAQLEQILGDTGTTGLGQALGRFFASWQSFSVTPGDPAARAGVVSASQSLASGIATAANGLVTARSDADREIGGSVNDANALLDKIAKLNLSITEAEASGTRANELRDQRDQAQRELSSLLGTTAIEQPNGELTILVAGGIAIVEGSNARHLTAVTNATTGMLDVGIQGGTQGALNASLRAGKLGAYLGLRDDTIPALQTQLDDFATLLITSVNAVHSAGFGLDGTSGRDLFVPAAGGPGAAAAMAVSASIVADPQRIAAAQTAATLPGDNRAALAVAALQTQLLANGGTATLAQALTQIQSAVGGATANAQMEQQSAESSQQQLTALRESESGVSIEEQMTLLSRYQRAYEAASKVISTVDSMFDTLLNM